MTTKLLTAAELAQAIGIAESRLKSWAAAGWVLASATIDRQPAYHPVNAVAGIVILTLQKVLGEKSPLTRRFFESLRPTFPTYAHAILSGDLAKMPVARFKAEENPLDVDGRPELSIEVHFEPAPFTDLLKRLDEVSA
jgi:hypothetical protein